MPLRQNGASVEYFARRIFDWQIGDMVFVVTTLGTVHGDGVDLLVSIMTKTVLISTLCFFLL